MKFFERLFSRTVTDAARQYRSEMRDGIRPPARNSTAVTTERATSLHAVYRALEILTGSASQISIDSDRDGAPVQRQPAILRRPSLEMDRPDFIEQTVMSLAVDGNFFWHKRLVNDELMELELWNPFEVGVSVDQRTGVKTFRYRGKDYTANEVVTRGRGMLPGMTRGKSVIQACREDMAAVIQTRDFAGAVFEGGGVPDGIISGDKVDSAERAVQVSRMWRFQDPATGEPVPNLESDRRVRVLGYGLKFQPITINPKDAQWIESQAFNVTVIARMFGVPASLMLASLEGNSQTYANVSQDWLAFVRFTLVGYLRKIESAFTDILPTGQRARFNLEALLRADTETRYKGHAMALGRWMTVDEVRSIENLPPLTDAQRADLDATPTTTTAPAPAEGATP